ncbi:MAG: HYR domain-containing protein, partial [Acidobacteriia bacterium]|nr:HYR domain-containing protein [Terriglobia bacterium]
STCYPKTCGGDGQRACALDERSVGHPGACDLGLLEIPGCSGDCQGFGANHYASSSMCIGNVNQRISEPTTNRTSVAPPDACAVSGYADLHLHLFADTAHGGGILAGEPYDPNGGGVNVALQQDYGTTKDLVDFNGVDQAAMNASICPYGLNNCGTNFFHKDHLLDDPVGSVGTNDAAGSNLGAPIFNGWPRWTSTTHQQAYFQWLKRAYEGGMRLTTMLAVTNSALCKGNKRLRGFNCDDSMHEIDNQIEAAKKFETWINDNDGGWFKIVYSPVEARSAIANGKLAVVLGIEVDNLFNCSFPTQQVQMVGGIVTSWNFNTDNLNDNCNPVALAQKLDHYYDLGIRHVFPIHNFDNGYGSPATWMSGIEFGNRVSEGHWWQTENCPNNYGFKSKVGSFGNWASLFSRFIGLGVLVPDEMLAVDVLRGNQTTTCNTWGLYPLGVDLINGLMDRGMIIDVDHMSNKALDSTLTMATNRGYPVVATHVLSYDMHIQNDRHERMRTKAQLERIRDGGGMIAAMLKDDVQDTNRQHDKVTVPYGGVITDDCQQSSKSFAQAYQYAVDVMRGPVAFGSDFNGVAAHIGPRFGSDGCGGIEPIIAADRQTQRDAQYTTSGRQRIMKNPLNYPFTIDGFGTFDRQVTGMRTFDFNVDGMAHIGMLPDFVAELKTVGLPEPYMNSIMQSAEQYIRVWERSWSHSTQPPLDESGAVSCPVLGSIAATPNPVRAGNPAQFSQSGFTSAGGATYSWSFGDGATGTGVAPQHTYAHSGTYTATLQVTGRTAFNTASTSVEVFAGTPPAALFVRADLQLPGGQVGHYTLQGYSTDNDVVSLTSVSCGGSAPWDGPTNTGNVQSPNLEVQFACLMPFSQSQMIVSATLHDRDGDHVESVTVSKLGSPPQGLLDGPSPILASQTGHYFVQGYSTDGDNVSLVSVKCGAGNPVNQAPDDLAGANLDVRFDCRFPNGPSSVTVAATLRDADGDHIQTKTVQVIDDIAPVVFLNGRTIGITQVVKATDPDGARANYTATAQDNFDGPLTPTCTTPSGSTFPIGVTTVTCRATDHAGNTAALDFGVWVLRDPTPPSITAPQAYSPQHHWRLDDGVRNTGSDLVVDTGFARTLVNGKIPNGGPTSSVGRAICVGADEHALELNGNSNSVVTFGTDVGQFVQSEFTTAFWFKKDPDIDQFSGGHTAVLLSTRNSNGDPDVGSFEVRYRLDPDGVGTTYVVEAELDKSFFSTFTLRKNIGTDSDGVWHHVAVTQRPDPNGRPGDVIIDLYVDGQLAQSDFNIATPYSNGQMLVAGGTPRTSDGDFIGTFKGSLDEIEIFDRALTRFEIGTLYRAYSDTASTDPCEPLADLEVPTTGTDPAVATFTAVVNDIVDGVTTAECTPASGTTFAFGPTPVVCEYTDTFDNWSSVSFVAVVKKSTRPTLTMPSDITKEATGPDGAIVTFEVTSTDSEGHPLTPSCSFDSGDRFPLESTTVECETSDGEETNEGSFVVNVVDTTPPTITPPANVVVEATSPNGTSASYGAPIVTDIVDGTSDFVFCWPFSGYPYFGLGATEVSCEATDRAFNQATATFTVTVRDTIAPVLTVPNTINVAANTPGGAVVNFNVTATDAATFFPAINCAPASGSTFPSGVTTVQCTATDLAGNVGRKSFDVHVTDNTPPVVAPLPNQILEATGPGGATAAFTATATDDTGVTSGPTCAPVSGSTFAIGTTSVTCDASDAAGNVGSM